MDVSNELNAKLKTYRLSVSEFKIICDLLGREPRGVEWALFSALWSEHCSYKSSKVHLRQLFSQSPRVVQSFGENAGVVDLGQGERVAFKIESHNHPSFIEPYQGAATGVGGILRDIFTMGARPVALANYLCFGRPEAMRMPSLVDGVVRGISGYGNSVGVATLTGQTEFHESYDGNILVNALAVGVFGPEDQIFLSKASGPGNWLIYVGAKTGRDGVHGASMASESFEEDSSSKGPTVQIGDPFYEKLLIESCLEVMKQDLVVAIQDMGAAGLTSSSFEMASKGGVGFRIHLDSVPLRDSSMFPEDILLSESQERMLLVCEPAKFEQLKSVFHRWNLDAVKIGEVTEERTIRLQWRGEVLTEVDPDLLVENAPRYERPYQKWSPRNRRENRRDVWKKTQERFISKGLEETLLGTLSSCRGTARDWIYRQYDQRVGAATVRDCSNTVGVHRLKSSGRALGLVLGCRPYLMRFDAAVGGLDAVAYPALELASLGFEALAVTDCLNFGNPEKPEVMSEFVAALGGMNSICENLKLPIVSGNVSFYNETMGKNITPTPSTGLIGLRDSVDGLPKDQFSRAGLAIYLISFRGMTLGGLYQEESEGESYGTGSMDAKNVAQYISFVREVVNLGPGLESSRVVGKYGLAYALARMSCHENQIGAKVDFEALRLVRDEIDELAFFEERLYEVIVAVDNDRSALFEEFVNERINKNDLIQVHRLGTTEEGRLQLGTWLNVDVNKIREAYYSGWEKNFENLA